VASDGEVFMRGNRAFSMVELAVVLSIVALLLGLGVWRFYSWYGGSKVRSVAEKLVMDIEYAMSKALQEGSSKISFYSSEYRIYAPAAAVTPLKRVTLPSGVGLAWSLGSGASEIVFSRSTLPNRQGTITVSGYNRSYSVVVNMAGRIRIE